MQTSDIGYGIAEIFRSDFKDKSASFKDYKEVYVAKDLNDGIRRSIDNKDQAVVLVTHSAFGGSKAYPIIKGQWKLDGLFSGSFIYTSNGVVMKGYEHPIKLMDRFE